MNFHHKWVHWIKGIFNSSRISVLVNGAPTPEFSPNRGLRQGDPLSPLIFNLVREVLSLLLSKAASFGLFEGIALPGCRIKLLHLQFADDVLLFINGGENAMLDIKRVLQCFQVLSGLKINFNKSHLHGFSQNKAVISEWAKMLGCQEGGNSFKYLGVTIGLSPRNGKFWTPLIDRIQGKIRSLEAENISMAGKVIILKSIIDSIPVYWFGLYKLPKIVIAKIKKLRRDLFWGHKEGQSRKLHLKNWEAICAPRTSGGLGLTTIAGRNTALLAKWWWQAYNERTALWNKVLTERYGAAWNYDMSTID